MQDNVTENARMRV